VDAGGETVDIGDVEEESCEEICDEPENVHPN
jgi:hypothetical protein